MILRGFILFSHIFSMSSGYGFYLITWRTLSFSTHSIMQRKQPNFIDSAQESTYTSKEKKKTELKPKQTGSFKERSSAEIVMLLSTEAYLYIMI